MTTTNSKYPLASTILAAAKDGTMNDAEIRHAVVELTKLLDLKASANNAKAKRVEKMSAAKANPKFKPIIDRLDGDLKRIGLDGVNAFAETGTLRQLDDALRASKLEDKRRFQIKENAAALGLID
jgi:hypothetical protein